MDLMSRYINQGRFGTFVQGFLEQEVERRKQEAEKNEEWMLWTAYIHSYSEMSFADYKKSIQKTDSSTKDAELDDDGIKAIIDNLFPPTMG
jgi:hypothetical protein